MTKQEIINEFIEKGADLEHARWAKWQKYMFSKMNYTEQEIDGKIVAFYVLPADLWERWNRQIDTPYSALSEQEKDSDRKQTKEYLPLLEKSLTEFEQAVREETIKECVEKEKNYKNTIGEACIVLAKILSQKPLADITEDELHITRMHLEGKRQQDEINYIRDLKNQIAELKERLKNYMEKEKKIYTSKWTAEPNPLYWVVCPHCKADILMTKASLIEKLKRWASRLLK